MILSALNKVSIRYDTTIKNYDMMKSNKVISNDANNLNCEIFLYLCIVKWCVGLGKGKKHINIFGLYVTLSCWHQLSNFGNNVSAGIDVLETQRYHCHFDIL